MDAEIILNVIIGCFIYNIFLKALGTTIVETLLKTKAGKEGVKKAFKERMEEKGAYQPNKDETTTPPKGKGIKYH